jgi:hypothetical protein
LYHGSNNEHWLTTLFPKHNYDNFFVWLKYDFLMDREHLADFSEERIFDLTSKNLSSSIDGTYMKHLDRRVRWFIDARKAVENETKIPSIEDYSIGIDFFDTSIPEKVRTDVYSNPLFLNKTMLIELMLPWKAAVKQKQISGWIPMSVKIEPEDFIQIYHTSFDDNLKQIKKPVFENFSPQKIEIVGSENGRYYMYEGKILLRQDKMLDDIELKK